MALSNGAAPLSMGCVRTERIYGLASGQRCGDAAGHARIIFEQCEVGLERAPLAQLGQARVAGLRPFYEPDELVGKTIVVVWNLEPARIRGEESQGMLLAAQEGDTVSVLSPDKPISPGQQVR